MSNISPIKAPCGSWVSPISAQALTAQSVRLAEPRFDPVNSDCYWLESRPLEKGRSCIVKRDAQGNIQDATAAPINVRSKAHEYGGGHYCAYAGTLYFVLADDQRIYSLDTQADNAAPVALTPKGPYRYADLSIDTHRQQLIAIREDHSVKGDSVKSDNGGQDKEEQHQIVAISLATGGTTVLQQGCDFYSNPAISPDGTQLSWLSWNHPDMPWDNTQVWCAKIDGDNQLTRSRKIAGGNNGADTNAESCFQPSWSPDNQLYWVSDKNNWWNLYRLHTHDGIDSTECVFEMAAEFATPQWVFGMSCYSFVDADTLLCCYSQNGQWHLACIDFETHMLSQLDTPYSDISAIAAHNGHIAFLGAAATHAAELVLIDGEQQQVIARSSNTQLEHGYLSTPQAVSFPSGKNNNGTNNDIAHGFYYPPHNQNYQPLDTEKPPLIVLAHGGPTGATEASLNLKIQYWSSRGFAVLDVNYRGSTGYGRVYRDALKGNWGISDVEDVCSGANYLVQQGLADPARTAIKGSSAGGYTVLAALAFSDTFQAGCSLYGIGDLQTLACDTHKFESRYLDSLVGPWPDDKRTYLERSPINHIDKLNCPVIFFQGLDDKVVPPNQAEDMFNALIQKGIATAYVPFAGEGHGFRQAPNIERALEGESDFYGKVFGFAPSDKIQPVDIQHADTLPQGNI